MGVSKRFRQAVLSYKYTSPNLSLLESLCLNRWWEYVTTWYPRWLAPNLITLTGFACILTSSAISWAISPDGRGQLPKEYYGVIGLLTFAYQTLDGSDGKQARRTKSGSALGELMDHGVDALTTSICLLFVLDCLGFGLNSFLPWSVVFLGQIGFYLSNLTLLHVGKQVFNTIDVMEAQTTMITAAILTSVFGVSFWLNKVRYNEYLPAEWQFNIKTDLMGLLNSYPGDSNNDYIDFTDGFELRYFVIFGAVFGCISNIATYLWKCLAVYVTKRDNQPQHVQNGVIGTGLGALFHQVFQISLFSVLQFCAWWQIRTNLSGRENQSNVYMALLWCSTFSFGDAMDRILVLRVAREQFPLIAPGILHMASFLVAVTFFDKIAVKFPTEDTFQVPFYWFPVLTAVLGHLFYFISRGGAIASALNIHPFKVRDWQKLKFD